MSKSRFPIYLADSIGMAEPEIHIEGENHIFGEK